MLATCGFGHTVCVDEYGNVWSFGQGSYGQLGHGRDVTQNLRPEKIEGLEHITQVSCGFYHTICLDQFGSLWAFGINVYGQLGSRHTDQQSVPQKITSFGSQISIETFSCGYNHTVCVDTNGKCYSFGQNEMGQLGHRKRTDVKVPKLVSALQDCFITNVACKGAFSLFLEDTGHVKSVGCNTSGQLGINEISEAVYVPQDVVGLENIVAISAGYAFSLFLDSYNVVYSCGENSKGQLGHGDKVKREMPQKIDNLLPVCGIGCGYAQTMFIDTEGNLWGAGSNDKGGLGLGDIGQVDIPVQIPNVHSVCSISHSTYHTLIKQMDGSIMVFGDNKNSQLGIKPETKYISTPTALEGYSHIIGIPNQNRSRAKSARN